MTDGRFKILTLNNIAVEGLRRFPREHYEVASEIQHPDAILVRSADMHGMEIPGTLKAVGRAGVGVNNIPLDEMSKRGIPVFNSPGANANAVKELVIASMFLAARNICPAWSFVRALDAGAGNLIHKIEAAKKQYVGFELPGKVLGVVGLGAVGVEVANAALGLGLKAIGFDPKITVQRAWQLSSGVEQASSLDDLFSRTDIVTVHVPLVSETHNLINAGRLRLLREGSVLLNFARGEIVDESAVAEALDSGRLATYVSDFPTPALKDHPRVVALPHLGASTHEAESNCAVMVAENIKEYLENGNIRRSVNFPEAVLPRTAGNRLVIANANVPNMVGQITTALADAGLNIADLLNKSLGDLAYTVVDVEGRLPRKTYKAIAGIDGVLAIREL